MDKTFANTPMTLPKTWHCANVNIELKKESSKKYIIIHAGSKKRLAWYVFKYFTSTEVDDDYQKCVNGDVFKESLANKLLPNIPHESIIVMDNASYHSVRSNKPPLSGSKEAEIIKGLTENEIPFEPSLIKIEIPKWAKLRLGKNTSSPISQKNTGIKWSDSRLITVS